MSENGQVINTWQYDANGNRTHENGQQTAVYDSQDRLISSSKPLTIPSRQVSYTADALGRRIERRVDNQPESGFIYQDRLNPIARTDSQGTIQEFFVYGEQGNVPAYLLKDGKTYRYITNHLGSPVMLVDSKTGDIAQEITYDVWGNVLSDSNPDFQPFYFAGGIYDQDTKLTRFGARDYDAQLGRWTAKDPIGFSGGLISLYDYVGGDPVNWIDTTGAAPHKWPDGNYSDNEGQYYDIERDIDNAYNRVGEGIAEYGWITPPILIGGGYYGGTRLGLGMLCKSAIKPRGWLNRNRYLRIGWSKGKKAKATLRVSGNMIKKIKKKNPHIDLYESQRPFKRGDYEL